MRRGRAHEVGTEAGIGEAAVDAVTATVTAVTVEAEADVATATGADGPIAKRTTTAMLDFLMAG